MAGRNVVVRQLADTDAPALFDLRGRNPGQVARYGERINIFETVADVRKWIRARLEDDSGYCCGIWDSNTLVGFIELTFDAGWGEVAQIGYWLGEEFMGRGYMTEAVRILTRYAIEELGIDRLRARVHPDNLDSQRVLQRVGYMAQEPAAAQPKFLIFLYTPPLDAA